jgi:hypothetical protein
MPLSVSMRFSSSIIGKKAKGTKNFLREVTCLRVVQYFAVQGT